MVGTSGIRIGKAREASLDYIVGTGGTITNAVSSQIWPGEAALNVSMVNWAKAKLEGPHYLFVDGQKIPVAQIPTHLQLHVDTSRARQLVANQDGTAIGVQFGCEDFRASGAAGFAAEAFGRKPFIRPIVTGDDLLRGRLDKPDVCIWLVSCATEQEAKSAGGAAFEHLRRQVYPFVKKQAERADATEHHVRWLRTWWKPHWPREEYFASMNGKKRMIACSNPQARPVFVFLSSAFVPTNTMQVFAYDDDYSFGVIQSGLHWEWTKSNGGKVRQDIRYTTRVWRTFPWPQDPTDEQVAVVAAAARNLRRTRSELMDQNGWSLRALYQAADVEGPHPLKDAQAALDVAVREAYGIPSDLDPMSFLLELNQLVAEDEEQGHKVLGPGLPEHLERSDPRWMTTDCIEPPAEDERGHEHG